MNSVQPEGRRDAPAAPGLPSAAPRSSNPPPSGGSSAVVDQAAPSSAGGNVSVGEREDDGEEEEEEEGQEEGGGGKQKCGEGSDEDDEGDEEEEDQEQGEDEEDEEEEDEEEDEDEDEDEDEEEEDQSDYDGEAGGLEEAGGEGRDLVVDDVNENTAAATATVAPQGSQRGSLPVEQQALQGIIDDVASFSVGGEQPPAERDPPDEQRGVVVAETGVLTEAERGARAAKAFAEAAAMQELSSKLFPLLVERLPGVLGQDAVGDLPGKKEKVSLPVQAGWAGRVVYQQW